jgi:hypothetical protein
LPLSIAANTAKFLTLSSCRIALPLFQILLIQDHTPPNLSRFCLLNTHINSSETTTFILHYSGFQDTRGTRSTKGRTGWLGKAASRLKSSSRTPYHTTPKSEQDWFSKTGATNSKQPPFPGHSGKSLPTHPRPSQTPSSPYSATSPRSSDGLHSSGPCMGTIHRISPALISPTIPCAPAATRYHLNRLPATETTSFTTANHMTPIGTSCPPFTETTRPLFCSAAPKDFSPQQSSFASPGPSQRPVAPTSLPKRPCSLAWTFLTFPIRTRFMILLK